MDGRRATTSQAGATIPVAVLETRDAGSGAGKWVSYSLASSIVAKASGLDVRGALKWLRDSSLPPRPLLRARVAPAALAEHHVRIEREVGRSLHPDRTLIASRRLCVWLPPTEVLARAKGFATAGSVSV